MYERISEKKRGIVVGGEIFGNEFDFGDKYKMEIGIFLSVKRSRK
jgi:hypothetical protein